MLSPTPSQMNMSMMSKVRSAIEDQSDFGFDENDAEILADYHQFFVVRKQAIIDQWEKDMGEERKKQRNNKAEIKIRDDISSSENESENEILYASEEDLKIANEFLEKFLIQSESSVDGQIDLQLVIKALPDSIKSNSIFLIQLFNFKIFQAFCSG